MGAYLNKPVIDKETEVGQNGRVRFAATTMQGWRVNQEDSHNCILEFDIDCSLFAVYDGHGGSEVARYTSMYLPDLLKSKESWKAGDYQKAMDEAFIEFDDLLRSESVLKELKVMAGGTSDPRNENSDDEDKEALCEEASMPLESLLQKYGFALRADRNGKAVINLKDLHSLREQHERLTAGLEEVNEEVKEKEKKKKRVCESPIGEAPKRTKSNENENEKKSECVAKEEKTTRRHCVSESQTSNSDECDGKQNNGHTRERASKSESEAAEEKGNELKHAPDMRQIAEQCRFNEKPQPSATPETQTAVSSDSEQSVDDDYNEDEEMSEEEEESDDADEDEPAYCGPSGDTPGEDSGTTACVLLLTKDKVIVGNAGDSRAVLCRKGMAIDLSVDHKPEDASEKTRIEAAGGEISMDGRVNGGLNLSRALGDHFYKKNETLPLHEQMISAQPDVTVQDLQSDDEFIIVACDGIWNSLSSQQAVDFVRKRISSGVPLKDICEQMCNECLSPNTQGDGTGCDNMTIIVAGISHDE